MARKIENITKMLVVGMVCAMVLGSGFVAVGSSVGNAETLKPRATPKNLWGATSVGDGVCLNADDGTTVGYDAGTNTGVVRMYMHKRSAEIGDGVTFPDGYIPGGTDKVGVSGASGADNAWYTQMTNYPTEWNAGEYAIFIVDKTNPTTLVGYTTAVNLVFDALGDQFLESGKSHRIAPIQPPVMGTRVDISVPFSWSAIDFGAYPADNMTGYRIERNSTAAPAFVTIQNVSSATLTFTDTIPDAAATYWYRLGINYAGKQGAVEDWTTNVTSLSKSLGTISTPPAAAPTLTNGAVTPASGTAGTTSFTYNVTYIGTNPPAATYPKVRILNNGVSEATPTMSWTGGVNSTGANYTVSTTLAQDTGTGHTAWFNATDGTTWATESQLSPSGPTVGAPTYLPNLIQINVTGVAGWAGDKFINASQTWLLECQAYNNSGGGWYGKVSADWIVNTTTGGPIGVFTETGTATATGLQSVTFDPTKVGTGNITATYTGTGGPKTNKTGVITVSAGAFAKIVITNLAGGGAWFAGTPIPSGSTISLNASGYDSDNNYLGLAKCDWTVSGGIGTVLPTLNTNTTIFTATTAGSGQVTAVNTTTPSITNSTGAITVTVPFQPDLLLEGDGNALYRTNATVVGTVQDKTVTLSLGQSKNWTIVLQNDGTQLPGDTITVRWWVAAQTAGWTGNAQMYNGTNPIPSSYPIGIPAGDFVTLSLNVTANGGVGDYCDIRVNATSAGTGNPQDCVRTVTSLPAAAEAWWIATWECPSPASTELTYTISVQVYNNYSAGQVFTVSLTITGATTYSGTQTTAALAVGQTGWANFTGITFNAGDSVVTVQVTNPPGNPSTRTVTTKAVTIPPAPTTSFEPTVIGIGIAVLVVAVLGTVVVWRKKKEKKKTEK